MQNKRLTKENSQEFQQTAKRSSLVTGTLIVVILLITPYIFYLYQSVPSKSSWDTFFGVYTSRGWENVQTLAWILMGKIIPFFLLLIWFFTCKHWWYHALLVPICMYAFQIYSTISDDVVFADSNEFFAIAPIILVMAIFSYTIRMRVFDKIHGIDFSELSRGNWKGEIATPTEEQTINNEEEYEEDDDDEPLFMHY